MGSRGEQADAGLKLRVAVCDSHMPSSSHLLRIFAKTSFSAANAPESILSIQTAPGGPVRILKPWPLPPFPGRCLIRASRSEDPADTYPRSWCPLPSLVLSGLFQWGPRVVLGPCWPAVCPLPESRSTLLEETWSAIQHENVLPHRCTGVFCFGCHRVCFCFLFSCDH